MNLLRNSLPLALALVSCAGLAAQSAERTRTFSYGDSEWGGSARFAGHAAFSTTQRTAILRDFTGDLGAEVQTHANLAGNRIEAFDVRGDFDANLRGSFSLSGISYSPSVAIALNVRIGGATIYRRESTQTASAAFNPSTRNLVAGRGFNELVQVGPVAVTVYANGVADIDCNLRPRLALLPPSIGLELVGTGEVNGSFGASVGVLGFAVGVSGTVDLADPRGTVEVHTNFVTVGGSVGWSIDAIRLFLQVFARAPLLPEFRVTVVDRDFAGTTGSLPFGL